ncbi:MAG: IS1380 family transposase [Streptosporangiaceae bacterium]
MRLSHDPARTRAVFDDPNLVSRGGLVPVMSLAERAGLFALAREHVSVAGPCGANAGAKIGCLVAGMTAGADSIDDMDVLRHGAMPGLFDGVRAPSTLGSFLRSFTWGSVRQLGRLSRELLAGLAGRAELLPDAGVLAFVDIDSTQKRVYGHAKQGAAFGHTKIQGKTVLVRGLNALAATICTPRSAPVIASVRLRGGSAGSARGAASLVAEAIAAARQAGCTGIIVARADSAYYSAAFTAACSRAGAHFSVTARMDPAIARAIAGIGDDKWTPIKYPQAIWDDRAGQWISDAEVAEAGYEAFASRKGQAVTARLIVRRVRAKRDKASQGTGELFPAWRYHAVFTDSPFTMLQAEAQHRDHAIIEQAFADWADGPMAHLPSGKFTANAAWLALAAIAFNLTRAAGAVASPRHARARAATIRRDLIDVAARTARHGRGHLTLHLPAGWHHEHEWTALFEAACGPPAHAA